jgi:hypothetical protein
MEDQDITSELSPSDNGKAPIATIEKELTINFRDADVIDLKRRSSSKDQVRRRRRMPSADSKKTSSSRNRSPPPEVTSTSNTEDVEDEKNLKAEAEVYTKVIKEDSSEKQEQKEQKQDETPKEVAPPFLASVCGLLGEMRRQWPHFVAEHPREWEQIKVDRNKCFCAFLILTLYCGFGGFLFRFFESAFEHFYKCGVKRVKRDFVDGLWVKSQELRAEEWKSLARRKLMEFENQLQEAYDAGVNTYSGKRSWSFLNAVVYCITVVTTIGESFHV